jgi:hypothetical protein
MRDLDDLSEAERANLTKKREERKTLLSPQQLAIVQRWDAEKVERGNIIEQAREAADRDDRKLWRELAVKACKFSLLEDPNFCEHGRSIMGTCAGCEDIERILTPELFDDE